MMRLIPLPAFQDNDLWLLHDGQRALVVDPGDAQPVLDALQRESLELAAILVTHHPPDHTGGVDTLRDATRAQGLRPRAREVSGARHAPEGRRSHRGARAPVRRPGRCGRLFEGTPARMARSLEKLAALPGETRVCCTHEYTLSNLNFALAVEPGNLALISYSKRGKELREQGRPTLPSTVGQQKQVNPFLRTREPAVVQAARGHDAATAPDEVGVFTTLRQWKNAFR